MSQQEPLTWKPCYKHSILQNPQGYLALPQQSIYNIDKIAGMDSMGILMGSVAMSNIKGAGMTKGIVDLFGKDLGDELDKYFKMENDKVCTNQNFSFLQRHYPDLHIFLLENNKADFLENLALYDLRQKDYEGLLNSTIFTLDDKKQIIKSINSRGLPYDTDLLHTISQFYLNENFRERLDDKIYEKLISADLINTDKVKLFLKQAQYNPDMIPLNWLSYLGEPYSDLKIPGKAVALENNKTNKALIDFLKEKGCFLLFKENGKLIEVENKKE